MKQKYKRTGNNLFQLGNVCCVIVGLHAKIKLLLKAGRGYFTRQTTKTKAYFPFYMVGNE